MKEELAAIEQCWFLLETLSFEQRERVIEWLRLASNHTRLASYNQQMVAGLPLMGLQNNLANNRHTAQQETQE